jgi:plasmid stabilization system protein ParE
MQRDTDRAAIKGALDALRQYPIAGCARKELRPARRTVRVRRHVIVYRLDGERVGVLRILHERMDIDRIIARSDDELPA